MLQKPFLAFTCFSILAASGCVVVDNSDPAPIYYGTLDTIVTIDGTTDPGLCAYYGIDRVDVAVYDGTDTLVADEQPICEQFGVAFDMPSGPYIIDVTLLAPGGSPLSDTVSVGVDVFRDDLTILEVDFPDGSIY
jgi:hypothetical protein